VFPCDRSNLLGRHFLDPLDVLLVEQRISGGEHTTGQNLRLVLDRLLIEHVLGGFLPFGVRQFGFAHESSLQFGDLFENDFPYQLKLLGLSLRGDLDPPLDEAGVYEALVPDVTSGRSIFSRRISRELAPFVRMKLATSSGYKSGSCSGTVGHASPR